MSDRIIIELMPGWALAFDARQWILMKVDKTLPGAEKTVAGARLRAVSFIGSEKRILRRCMRENGVVPTPAAAKYLDAMPETFFEWLRQYQAARTSEAT